MFFSSKGSLWVFSSMPVSIQCYRARIGCFNYIKLTSNRKSSILSPNFLYFLLALFFDNTFFKIANSIVCSFIVSIFLLLCALLLFFVILISHVHDGLHFLSSAGNLLVHKPSRFFIKKLFHFFELSLFIKSISTIIMMLLTAFGTVEKNPGPLINKINLGVWNLDSLLARDGVKKTFIEGLDSSYNFDLFGVCETYLTSSVDNSSLKINGFSDNPFRADCKYATQPQGGVCLFFKEHMPIVHRNDLEFIDETVVAEIKLKNKKIFVILSYRPPSQRSNDDITTYCMGLQRIVDTILKEKPSLIVLTGDFNARSPLFWEDEQLESLAGKSLSNLMLLNCFEQLINEPTHFPRGEIETCLDLILTDKPSAFVHCGVIPSPDPRCKHQIVNGIINFSVPTPPPYKRRIWKYDQANIPLLKRDFSLIDWDFCFRGASLDEMVSIFSEKFLSIASIHIPNEHKTFNDRDAPWVTPKVKSAVTRNHRVYKKWKDRGKPIDGKAYVKTVQSSTSTIIEEAKKSYLDKLSEKLSNPKSNSNIFWSAFKRILNCKKMSNIPPLIENGIFHSCFSEKANIFNKYFAMQCTPLQNNSTLPNFIFNTDSLLSNVIITEKSISDIISKLNSNKAHGVDNISISMLKLCHKEVLFPLKLIFERSLAEGKFPSSWKLANVQPVHKKDSRQCKKNYRPISLLPICSKILEKIIFDEIYHFLTANNLLSKHQSGFRPGDSTINQLLSITNDIFMSFEEGCETRAVFLDISKAFDKVWHEGLLFKLKQNGINGKLLSLISDFLTNRHQRVVLNGQESSWEPILSGVPQGSVLGPLLFLVYINDLTDNISSSMRLFADDSSLFLRVRDIQVSHDTLMSDLEKITQWANQWKMQFNPDISKQAIEVIFSQKRTQKPNHPPLTFNGIPVKRESDTKHLGLFLDDRLTFRKHINEKIKKANKGIGLLKFLSKYTSRRVLDTLYKLYVRPHLDYGDVIYHDQLSDCMKLLESVQYNAALIVAGCWKGTNTDKIYDELGWEKLSARRHFRRLTLFYKICNGLTPSYLTECVTPIPNHITDRYSKSFFPYCQKHFAALENSIKNSPSLSVFKSRFLKVIRPPSKPYYDITDKYGLSLLVKLRVSFSDLRDHRYRHNFNCPSPICSCKNGVETSAHFLLSCSKFSNIRTDFISKLSAILPNVPLLFQSDQEKLVNIMLYGSPDLTHQENKHILLHTIAYIRSTKRFKKLEAYSFD